MLKIWMYTEKVYYVPLKIAGIVTLNVCVPVVQFLQLKQYIRRQKEYSMQYYDKKAVGERIKAIRLRNGMTQSRLAEELDYTSERQLQRIESGETSCSVDKLMELAQILGVSTDYLLFGYEGACRDDMEKYMSGKSGREKEYICRVLDAVVSNMGVLLNGE